MASHQCEVHLLAQMGHNHTPSQNPAIHSYYAPFFSPLPNSYFSPSGIPLLTLQFFFGLQAGRFLTHSLLYICLTNRLSSILSTWPNHLTILSFILSFTPFF